MGPPQETPSLAEFRARDKQQPERDEFHRGEVFAMAGARRVIPDPLPLQYKILYIDTMKPLRFRGTSMDDLRQFPKMAMREAGFQLDRVQHGLEPQDWKPMPSIAAGVKEIRISDEAGAFRVIDVAKFAEAVYVRHCFQKKTEQTSQQDINIATRRFKDLMRSRE